MWRQNNKLFFKCRIPQKDYSYKTFFACSQVFPLVAEVFLFVSRTAPSLWIIFCPFVSYNVNWHEDNLSVDQEHRWFVRGGGKFVFHEITSSAVCRWETCCGNILLLAWTPSSSSRCIKARFFIHIEPLIYLLFFLCRNGILIDPPTFFCKVPDSVKDGFSSWLETINGHWLRPLKVRRWLGHRAKYSPGVCEWWVTIHGARIGFSLSESASPQTMHFSHFQPNCSCDWILFVSEVWSWNWSLVFGLPWQMG